jgi:heme-degrading monooxygenase HmoA
MKKTVRSRAEEADRESPEQQEAGIRHVQEEVIPPVKDFSGLQGFWLVDRESGQRLSVMVWANEAASQAGMKAIMEERAKNPDRERPTPTSVQRFEVYGVVGSSPTFEEES